MTPYVFHRGRWRVCALLLALGNLGALAGDLAASTISDVSSCEGVGDSTALLQYSAALRPSQQRKSDSELESTSKYYPYSMYPVQGQLEMVDPEIAQVWPAQQGQAPESQQAPLVAGSEGYDSTFDWSGYAPAAIMPDYLSNGFEGLQNGEPEANPMAGTAAEYQYPSQTFNGNPVIVPNELGQSAGGAPAPYPSFAAELQQQSDGSGPESYAMDASQQPSDTAAFASEQPPQEQSAGGGESYPVAASQLQPQHPARDDAPGSYPIGSPEVLRQQQSRGGSPPLYPLAASELSSLQPQMSRANLDSATDLPSDAQLDSALRTTQEQDGSMSELLRRIQSDQVKSDLARASAKQMPGQALGPILQTPTSAPGVELQSLNNLLQSLTPDQKSLEVANANSGSNLGSMPALDSSSSPTDLESLQKLLSSAPVDRDNFNKILQSLGPSADSLLGSAQLEPSQVSSQMLMAASSSPVATSDSLLSSSLQTAAGSGSQNQVTTSEALDSLLNSFATRASDNGLQNPIAASEGLKNAFPSVGSDSAGAVDQLMRRFAPQQTLASGSPGSNQLDPRQFGFSGNFDDQGTSHQEGAKGGLHGQQENVEGSVKALESLDLFLQSNGLGRIAPVGR